jgi:hypothetical protein
MRLLGLFAVLVASASCGSALRESQSPVLLVVDSLQAAPSGGRNANTFGSILLSDVVVMLTTPAPCSATNPCPTYYNDLGQMTVSMTAKNVNIAPTANNQVTLTRYHVDFVRADGRNTQGVDVPYSFDGAVTATIPAGGSAAVGFELVRHSAKLEAPLVQLANNLNFIYTLARVTLYGHDAVGNDISVSGSLSVQFGNFADQ